MHDTNDSCELSPVVPLTDDRGKLLIDSVEFDEPEPGSVLLTEGMYGTAWQRHFADGQWHSTRGGRPRGWYAMLREYRNAVLIYDAPERD